MSSIEVLPFGPVGIGRYLAVAGAPAHLPEPYLRQWLGDGSPFLAYGQGAILVDGDRGALVVTANPRVHDGLFAAFGALTLAEGLTTTERSSVAAHLLEAAKGWGRERGLGTLRGPLLFSTWHPYRVLDADVGGYPFPGERVEPAAYQDYYRAAGLSGDEAYFTQSVEDIAAVFPEWPEDLPKLPLRGLRPDEIAQNLPQIHTMVTTTFERNAHYAHIDVAEFAAVLALDQPGSLEPLSTAATDDEDNLLGFAVGYGYQPPDGSSKIAILKTLGVLPEYRGGLVTWNVTVGFHEMVMEKCYRRAYHAMMKADNKSRKLSSKYGETVRTYRLFSGATSP